MNHTTTNNGDATTTATASSNAGSDEEGSQHTTFVDPLETNIDHSNNNNNNNVSSGGNATSGIHRRGRSNNNNNTSSSRSFVSRHRKVLDRIAVDSTESRRHPVPNPASLNFEETHGNDGSSNRSLSDTMSTGRCCAKLSTSVHKAVTQKSCDDWTSTLLPCYSWLKAYTPKQTFPKDLIAGLTVAVMVVPQSMSYAKLAGLPVEYGLYSALVPIYAYALFGSSRQLAVGPVALISLLLSTGLVHIMQAQGIGPDDPSYQKMYNRLAIQTSFLVGVTNIVMGLLRLGFITIFLSHAVISGFTTGAAVIIGLSQVKYIFGYEVERSDRFHEILRNIFENIDQFNWKTFLMGTCSIALLVIMKNVGKTYKRLAFLRALGPLTVTVLTIILTVTLSLDERGIPIIDHIPKGLPQFTADAWFPILHFEKLFLVVLSIVIVGFMESIAIAKTLASKHKYEIDSSLELIGLGMANFMGSMFQSYPVTGSFSRSAVNNESGAQTGISGMITATVVGLTLLFLTPIFEKLPLNVLAAIVISGVLGLLDYPEAIYLWKVHKFDFGVWLTACLGTMFLGVEIGLAIAVGVSLLLVIYESAYPHTSVLGRLPGTNIYRNVKQYPQGERYDGIVIVRIDAPLYFANAQNVRDKIRKYRLQAQDELDQVHADGRSTVRYLILELAPVSHMDTSALHILTDMYDTYLDRGQQMCFSNPSMSVMERMVSSGFFDKVGREHFFACLHDAVHYCLDEMDSEAVSIHESQHGGSRRALIESISLEEAMESAVTPPEPVAASSIGTGTAAAAAAAAATAAASPVDE